MEMQAHGHTCGQHLFAGMGKLQRRAGCGDCGNAEAWDAAGGDLRAAVRWVLVSELALQGVAIVQKTMTSKSQLAGSGIE